MSGYIEGVDREQTTLFPDRLEDWICEDHPVRVIDAFVNALDLAAADFDRSVPAQTGRPGYHPAVLLKHGYMNRVASSRRLEKEAGRNVEVMWLTGRLVPDHKTIADFRKENGPAIRKTCARFVELCRQIGVVAAGTMAIDGSKMKAVNNRDRNFTSGKVQLRITHLEQSAARYLEEMDRTDRREQSERMVRKIERLKEKLSRIRQEVQRLQGIATQLKETPDGQISLTDPDARSMATYGKGTGLVGYNVQTAVDTATHLIVAHDVTNVVHDRAPARRNTLPTRCAGVNYDPAATCPEWLALLDLIFPQEEVRHAFHRAMGMLLFGRNDAQVALLFRGAGGNGKSTVTAAIAAVMGENDGYTAACKIEMFIVTPNEGAGKATPEEVDIPGSRVMIASEPAATDELSAKKIKAMTGGDRRPARALGMPQFYYRPQAVPVLSFNRTPRIRDEDEGTRRRLVFFPFEVNLRDLPLEQRRNPSEIEAALTAERAGILNWMIDGWREYCRLGLQPSGDMQALKADVMERADPVGEFVADMCAVDRDGKISVGDAFTAYVEWCQRTGAVEYKKTGFANLMQEKGFRKRKTDGGRWWYRGLHWKPSEGVRDLLLTVNIAPPELPRDDEPAPF